VPSPREIAERIAAQGVSGFGPVVRATEARLYRIALRILADPADAEDAVQESYTRAYDALSRGRYDERLRVEAWLVTIVTRVSIDAQRSRKRQPQGSDDEPRSQRTLTEDQLAAVVELGRWLSALAPDQRAAVVLKHMEGMTSAEVGAILGISEGAVEQRLLRAKAALKRREADEPT
jgi:RNA polymerase sigma-70 factor, ECF subfamily